MEGTIRRLRCRWRAACSLRQNGKSARIYAVRDGGLRACTTFNDEANAGWLCRSRWNTLAYGGRMTGYVLYPKDSIQTRRIRVFGFHGGPKTYMARCFTMKCSCGLPRGYSVLRQHRTVRMAQQRVAYIRGKYARSTYDDLIGFVDQFSPTFPLDAPAWYVTGGSIWRLYDGTDHRAHQPFPARHPSAAFQLDLVFANERHWVRIYGRQQARQWMHRGKLGFTAV